MSNKKQLQDRPGQRPEDDRLLKLIEKFEELTNRRLPDKWLQDAVGLLLPGFTAVPPVTFVTAQPSPNYSNPERFEIGKLMAFESADHDSGQSQPIRTFFTPLENMTLAPLQFRLSRERTPDDQILHIEPNHGWVDTNIYFSWLPWRNKPSDSAKIGKLLELLSEDKELLPGTLEVYLVKGDTEIQLHPEWGLDSWHPNRNIESIVFPINHARELLAPFVFRLKIAEGRLETENGALDIEHDELALRFTFPSGNLKDPYRKAGLDENLVDGCTVVGNAIPVMNIDLKIWEPDLSYEDFINTSAMRPLGFAGVAPFKRSERSLNDDLDYAFDRIADLPYSTMLSIEFNENNRPVMRYALPTGMNSNPDTQVLFWMTQGESNNGRSFRYVDAAEIQPYQIRSPFIYRSHTIMPTFGGSNYKILSEGHGGNSLAMNISYPPNKLLTKNGIRDAVQRLLENTGYANCTVRGPVIEMRIIDGYRQRVAVVYIESKGGNNILRHHGDAIKKYCRQFMPVGIMLEIEQC